MCDTHVHCAHVNVNFELSRGAQGWGSLLYGPIQWGGGVALLNVSKVICGMSLVIEINLASDFPVHHP